MLRTHSTLIWNVWTISKTLSKLKILTRSGCALVKLSMLVLKYMDSGLTTFTALHIRCSMLWQGMPTINNSELSKKMKNLKTRMVKRSSHRIERKKQAADFLCWIRAEKKHLTKKLIWIYTTLTKWFCTKSILCSKRLLKDLTRWA